MAAHTRSIVLVDGDIPGLIALAQAAESAANESPQGKVLLWTMADAEGQIHGEAIRQQATLYAAELLPDVPAAPSEAELLLGAARWATEQSYRKLIWPAVPGVPGAPASVDVDRAGQMAERAMLVERLAALEDGRAPEIDPLFADLTDRQVADLALDMGLPIRLAWWYRGQGEHAASVRDRWSRAFEAAGMTIEPLTEDKPSTPSRPVSRPSR